MNRLRDRVLFMKVGRHAGEDFEQILARKREEYGRTGRTFWGYGGSTCHPLTQVQPFVRQAVEVGGQVYLVMESMDSKADPDLAPATEFSEDGILWQPLPKGITVTGSSYAVVLGEIKPEDLEVPLERYSVGFGRSEGRPACDYIQGRVDKACLTLRDPVIAPQKPRIARVEYSAEIIRPYAVLLRGPNHRRRAGD